MNDFYFLDCFHLICSHDTIITIFFNVFYSTIMIEKGSIFYFCTGPLKSDDLPWFQMDPNFQNNNISMSNAS